MPFGFIKLDLEEEKRKAAEHFNMKRRVPSSTTKYSLLSPEKCEKTNCERLCDILCLGCKNAAMSQTMLCQCLVMVVLIFFIYRSNAGLLQMLGYDPPLELRPIPSKIDSDVQIHFYNEIQGDGLLISWHRGVNCHDTLKELMSSSVMMLEGDIASTQNEDRETFVPKMVREPSCSRELSLQELMIYANENNKGLKLNVRDAKSLQASIPTLMANRRQMRSPIHISADILDGPNANEVAGKPLDPKQFLTPFRRKRLENVTVSLGWRGGWFGRGEELYTWSVVKAMFDTIRENGIHAPLSFNVDALLAQNSISQLIWLMEMTGGTATIYSPPHQILNVTDLAPVRRLLPRHKVLYNVKLPTEDINTLAGTGMGVTRTTCHWEQHGKTGDLYDATQSLILRQTLLFSKEKFPTKDKNDVGISGRLEFLGIRRPSKVTGFSLFLHTDRVNDPVEAPGIQCFISLSGVVTLVTRGLQGFDTKRLSKLEGDEPCFLFAITDYHNSHVVFNASRLTSCSSAKPTIKQTLILTLPTDGLQELYNSFFHLAIKASDGEAFVVVDKFEAKRLPISL